MKKRKIIVLFFISGLILFQCLPDRMPPSPIESQRPEFVSFSSEDSAAFAVPLRDPITMTFNEPMMLSSFADNFVLTSEQGDISGTFGEVDSTITFTPSEDMEPATIYTATVFGSVKDKNGNSLTLDENWKASTWFFTTGQYSENGFPLVFIADRSFDKLYKIGNFNELLGESSEVIQPKTMAFTPDGQHLLVASKQLDGKIAVIDPASFTKLQEVPVGIGPEDMAIAPDKIFVVNVSGNTVSVISFPGYGQLTTIGFTDGFRPRDIAYNVNTNQIYVSSNALNEPGTIKIIDANNYSEISTLTGIISGRRTEKMQFSPDGQLLVVQQEKTDFLKILDATTNQVLDSIVIPTPQNKDMDIYDDMLYVCSSGGSLYKYDLNSRVLIDSVSFTSSCDGVAVAPFGEILYATTPVDTLVHAIDVQTLSVIRSIKATTRTISKLIVSPENY